MPCISIHATTLMMWLDNIDIIYGMPINSGATEPT